MIAFDTGGGNALDDVEEALHPLEELGMRRQLDTLLPQLF